VVGKLKDARERDKTHKQVARYKRLLAEDTKNVLIREKLIRMYVVELDSPDEARKLLTTDVSEIWRTYVPLAAAKPAETPKAVCVELGDWYKSLIGQATPTGKANALARAKACVARFLELETNPVRRKIGEMRLAQLEKLEAELAEKGSLPKPKLTTLLNNIRNWRITNGKWVQRRGKIIGEGNSLLTFNRPIPGNCVLELRLNVISGSRPRIRFGGDLYVGNRIPGRRLMIRGAGKTQGKPRPYSRNKPMNLRIVLRSESIELYMDQIKVASGTRPPVKETTLAISAGDNHSKGTMEFYSFKITPLKGDGK